MISDNNNNHHHFNGESGDECDIEIITQILPYTLDLNKDIDNQDDYETNLYNYITRYADYHESDDDDDVFNDDSSIYNDDFSDDCTTVASSEPILADFFEERNLFIQSIRYLTVMEPLFALHPTEGITYDYEIDLDRFADINNRFNALYHFRNELLEIYDFDSPLFDLPSLDSQNLRNLNHNHNNINNSNNSNDEDLSVETKSETETESETEDENENENGNGNEPAFDLEAEFRNALATRLNYDYDDDDDYDNDIDYEIEQLDIDALNIGVYFPDLDLYNLSEISNTPNDSYQRTLFSTFENYWSQNNPSIINQPDNTIDTHIDNTLDNNAENSTDNNTDDTTDAIAGEIGEDDISVISLSSFYDRILSTK